MPINADDHGKENFRNDFYKIENLHGVIRNSDGKISAICFIDKTREPKMYGLIDLSGVVYHRTPEADISANSRNNTVSADSKDRIGRYHVTHKDLFPNNKLSNTHDIELLVPEKLSEEVSKEINTHINECNHVQKCIRKNDYLITEATQRISQGQPTSLSRSRFKDTGYLDVFMCSLQAAGLNEQELMVLMGQKTVENAVAILMGSQALNQDQQQTQESGSEQTAGPSQETTATRQGPRPTSSSGSVRR